MDQGNSCQGEIKVRRCFLLLSTIQSRLDRSTWGNLLGVANPVTHGHVAIVLDIGAPYPNLGCRYSGHTSGTLYFSSWVAMAPNTEAHTLQTWRQCAAAAVGFDGLQTNPMYMYVYMYIYTYIIFIIYLLYINDIFMIYLWYIYDIFMIYLWYIYYICIMYLLYIYYV